MPSELIINHYRIIQYSVVEIIIPEPTTLESHDNNSGFQIKRSGSIIEISSQKKFLSHVMRVQYIYMGQIFSKYIFGDTGEIADFFDQLFGTGKCEIL